MRRSNAKSSFNGIIEEVPDVSVDNFDRTDRKAYFLSHCHTDHMQGLFSDALLYHLKKNAVFIYMSEHSAAIVKHESGEDSDVANYIKSLKIGPNTITIPGDEENEIEEQYVTVELLPAGHCFGSVMFLFKTLYKTILYTGDFRISENSVCKYGQLHKNGDIINIDAMYVDTTFNSSHKSFPKRTESVEVVVRHIKDWLNAKDTNLVALRTPAKYGYEFVFNEIFKATEQKVYVEDDKWKFYSQFPTRVPGVTNQRDSRVHSCRNRFETHSHENCFPNSFQIDRHKNIDYLFVYFSALKWTDYKIEKPMIEIKKKSDTYRIDVCFATHCSKSELDYFVNYLSPKKVVGFPNEYIKGNVEPVTPSKRLAPRSEEKKSPEVKVARMVDRSTMRQIFSD